MPTGMPTILDIAKRNAADPAVGLIEEVINYVPELLLIPARSIRGQQYDTLVRTGLPTVGFRSANEGAVQGKSTYENRKVETFLMNPRWQCDKAVADINEDGAEAYIATEGAGQTAAAGIAIASQMYYGQAKDSKGFQGLASFVDADMIVDATGTDANKGTSVWFVRFGPQDVQWVFGANGKIALEDVRVESVLDANNKPYTAYVQEMQLYVGLAVHSKWSVCRIKNLTAQGGKGLTDSLLSQALERFPAGKMPNAIFMSRQSRGQLQRSRTATTSDGSAAPVPKEYEDIPIYASESIVNTEAIV